MNVFGYTLNNTDAIYTNTIIIQGQDSEDRYLKITSASQFYQSLITSSNKINFNLVSNVPDFVLNSSIPQILNQYALKTDVNTQVLTLANKTNAVFNGDCTFNSNLRIRGALALENM